MGRVHTEIDATRAAMSLLREALECDVLLRKVSARTARFLKGTSAEAARDYEFKPGAILHAAIIGAFRAHGSTFEQWCRENDVISTIGRQATHGQSAGENGKDILARMIAGAGEATIRQIYEARMLAHAEDIRRGQAA